MVVEILKKAVFLDRDGVLNDVLLKAGKPYPPENLESLAILPGVTEAIRIFKQNDFEIVVVTNQPDVKRGTSSKKEVDLINEHLATSLSIDNFYVCFHDELDDCSCRKPLPGMIFEAAFQIGIDLERSYMVGDRWRDIEAGQTAGCICYFIDHNYLEKKPRNPFITVGSLLEAAQHIERYEGASKTK